jgi:hypothetical protein
MLELILIFVLTAAGLFLALYLLVWFYIWLPSDMARERNREPFAWILISILGSPFLAIFLLWLLGDFEA